MWNILEDDDDDRMQIFMRIVRKFDLSFLWDLRTMAVEKET